MDWGKIQWLCGQEIDLDCEGDEVYYLQSGMMLRIPRNVPHHALVTSWEPCRMIIVYSAPDRQR
jgi:uncharacterized RmlC-like cupin family protein